MPLSLAALLVPATPQRLHAPDLVIVALYLAGITLFGLRFRKRGAGGKGSSLQSYFLADNTVPWWAIALSIVSAETSTLTIISVPGIAFGGDFGFLQVVLGYMLGRVVVAALFLPRYFAGNMLTAYQLIDRRFGSTLHKTTAGLFLCTRAAAEGVRVFAVSIVVGIAIGTGDVLSIAIISALTLLYTFEGGMAAVIWTDVVQMAIYIAGTLIAVWSLGHHVPGGWSTILHAASGAGKLHTFDFAANLTSAKFWATSYTFWAGLLGGGALTMASHGTDQLMVQRMLAARNLRESRLALLSSGAVVFFQFTLFLLIGAGLWAFYGTGLHSQLTAGHSQLANQSAPTVHATIASLSPDRIFPTFIVRELPTGVAGLLVAAILAAAMSNLSAALNSLSSSTVVDFYMHARPQADARERNLVSRASTVVWAFVLFALAVYSLSVGGKGHVVETGLSIASVAYGALLGVFLLGTLTRFATETGAALGMVAGFATNMLLWLPTITPLRTLGGHTIPHIAFTWYVLIGSAVTFAVGSLASLFLRSRRPGRAGATLAAFTLLPFLLSFRGAAQEPASRPAQTQTGAPGPDSRTRVSAPDFSAVDTLLTNAIAAGKLPGAVLVIGHSGHIVYAHAYGLRKLAGEPGLDGKPSPAEPMTEDTIFDMASLTKCLATATAVMQLYEAGKIGSFDDPVQQYLPDFNATNDPVRAKVTLRQLLTHFSGEPADVNLKDPWGLSSPDKAEGLHRALTTPLQSAPAATFRYSDINFILLGALVEKLSGQREDVYVQQHIFMPLGMSETTYHPFDRACGAHTLGSAVLYGMETRSCPPGSWYVIAGQDHIAPTAHDDESKSNPAANPNFDHLLRGTVHDPTTRRMGGVAGHAGVFSIAHDMSLFAQALLDRLAGRRSNFPLKQSTLELMTTPEQPGHTAAELAAAAAANRQAIAASENPAAPGPDVRTRVSALANPPDPLLDPNYPALKDQNLRAFGWDIDTAFSKPRGRVFPIGSFGHTGFTGTSLWLDPGSDTYVILLANAIHPRGNPPISALRGEVATASARALHLYEPAGKPVTSVEQPSYAQSSAPQPSAAQLSDVQPPTAVILSAAKDPRISPGQPDRPLENTSRRTQGPYPDTELPAPEPRTLSPGQPAVLTGIDVLESTHAAALRALAKGKPLKLGLLTNQSGLDSRGHRTIDYLASLRTDNLELTTLFSPEHGISGAHDTEKFASETEPATGLHVTSLYGAHDADRRPSHEQLAGLDAVVIDLQDAGVRTYTYLAVVGYFLEAAAAEKAAYRHDLAIVVLDRPNLIDGSDVQGPISDAGHEGAYADYMQIPVRHGFTLAEFAQYVNGEKHLGAGLVVVPLQNWQRTESFDRTGLHWTNPSPNLRNQTAAELLPGLTLLETTNVSVGRGTALPFELFGAGIASGTPSPNSRTRAAALPPSPWFHAHDVAAALAARHIPGVTFEPTTAQVDDDPIHPSHGQTIEAVRVRVTDRTVLDSPELGVEILSMLHRLYPAEFKLARAATLLASQATLDALARGDDPRTIAKSWQPALESFQAKRKKYLLY